MLHSKLRVNKEPVLERGNQMSFENFLLVIGFVINTNDHEAEFYLGCLDPPHEIRYVSLISS